MRRVALLVLVLAVRAAGGGEPGPTPREVPAAGPSAQAPGPADDLGRRLRDLGYASVPLDTLRSGYVTVRAQAGGRALRLILDTGSPFTALDRDRTAALKLAWKKDATSGPARGRDDWWGWDPDTRCEVPALALGPARAERAAVGRMSAGSHNRALAAVGDPPVDGLLGQDILTAVGALIDLPGGRLYVRPGRARVRPGGSRVPEFATRDVRLPTGADPARAAGWDKVRVYVSADRGKTWAPAGEYPPTAPEVRYEAPRDGEYWLAVQAVGKDGRAHPADPAGLAPDWKVRVNTARPAAVRPDPPPADLRAEAAALRREVERLRQRVRDLEAGEW